MPARKQQIRHAIAHLLGGLVRESHREDGFCGNVVGYQIRHPKCNRTRFASSSASKNQHRSFRRLGGRRCSGLS